LGLLLWIVTYCNCSFFIFIFGYLFFILAYIPPLFPPIFLWYFRLYSFIIFTYIPSLFSPISSITFTIIFAYFLYFHLLFLVFVFLISGLFVFLIFGCLYSWSLDICVRICVLDCWCILCSWSVFLIFSVVFRYLCFQFPIFIFAYIPSLF
jgi:hypothetical protein